MRVDIIHALALVFLAWSCMSARAGTLEEDFRAPPMAARPYVWWHWMGPNFSKEGITKDLEAMKASGIGGATIFNLCSAVQGSNAPTWNNPWPDQTYRSPKYWEAVRHAAAEADRLGLEVGLHNTVGYSTIGGPWIDEARGMQQLLWTSAKVTGGATVTLNLPLPPERPQRGFGATARKFSRFTDIAVLAVPAGKASIALSEVGEVPGKVSPAGKLRWNAPAGEWMVYRLGYGPTGSTPHPVPDDLIGKTLEADKMSLEQTRYHWKMVIDPLREHLGPLLGKSLRHFLIDSYEAGNQNWTPNFREEFQKRKGYDPLPWLMTMGPIVKNGGKGDRERIVEGPDQTARFEWDFRDVVAALFYENGWQPATELIHAAGCKLQFEPYIGPFSIVEGAALADLPMGEFWTGSKGNIAAQVPAAGRAAGRTVIGAEAFTGRPEVSKWTETPAALKMAADGAYGIGVNRLVLHHWVHQPFDDRFKPGMGMGWWGTHFGRNQTWAELGKEFYRYLGRVQAMLQRGETPADYVTVGWVQEGADLISPRAFLKDLRVEGGRIVLPSKRSYSFICLIGATLEPEMVRQIKAILHAGGTVVCSRPRRSPSLKDYPACDAALQKLAGELWGDNNEPVRKIGPGKLYASGDVKAALNDLGITPAARIVSEASSDVRIAHRRDGKDEIFFVANLGNKPAKIAASFRVSGMQPELWNAETASIELAADWRATDGRTEVDLPLGAEKSIFVVFRHKPTASARVSHKWNALPAIPVTGPWTVDLAPAAGNPRKITLEKLASLSESSDPDVKYFSGTATYRTPFRIAAVAKRVDLDLGDVRDLVQVTINGKNLGVLWHPPFVCNIASALRRGDNLLELAVVNTWHNRLVGDEQFPPDFEWGPDRGPKVGRALAEYPQWFVENRPRPEQGRRCLVIWYYHRKDTPLLPAGLLGPVQLVPQEAEALKSERL